MNGKSNNVWTYIKQLVKDISNDNVPQWAAAISYYTLLSIFPLLLAGASIAAFFVDPNQVIQMVTEQIGQFIPFGENRIREIVNSAIEARGTVSLLSIGTLLWTGSRVFSVLTQALNIAFDADEEYGFIRRTMIEFAMVFTLGLLLVLAFTSRLLINNLGAILLPEAGEFLLGSVATVVSGLLLFTSLLLVFRFVPRRDVSWKMALLGAGVSSILILVAQPLFTYFVNTFGNYNMIYGSLAIVVIMILWAWLVSMLVLFGAEIASHGQIMLIEGKSSEEVDRERKLRSPHTSKAEKEQVVLRHNPTSQQRQSWREPVLDYSFQRRTAATGSYRMWLTGAITFVATLLFVQLFGWLRKD
jgi:membrane protein